MYKATRFLFLITIVIIAFSLNQSTIAQTKVGNTIHSITHNPNPSNGTFGQIPIQHDSRSTTITESATQNIVTGNSVACNSGGLHTDNSYFRSFVLSSFGISGDFTISDVSIGVEQAIGATGTQPITCNLYTTNQPFPNGYPGSLTLIGSLDINVPDQSGTIFDIPVTGLALAGSELVVEIFTPNGQTAGNGFFIGSNPDGETAPSYLMAVDCGVTTPMTTGSIGFPGMMIVMNVTGDEGTPVGPGPATDPNPANNATNVDLNQDFSWANPGAATSIEVFFGTSIGSMTSIYSGVPITTIDPGTFIYNTNYYWKVNETDATGTTFGAAWTFKTMQNPDIIVEDFYPQTVTYWTGNTEGTVKTDGEINTVYPNIGWAVYDVSTIEPLSVIDTVKFFGYVNAANWPYWSATPMGTVNPVSDDATTIYNQAFNNTTQGVAYIYSDEASTFGPGWHNYLMESSAIPDLQAVVDNAQGWFAMGFVDRDGVNTYFVNFDGWSQTNPPYIEVTYEPVPVELTSFRADANNGTVVLNWQTATETNNQGFEIQRNSGNGYQVISFVQGNGTSTQIHNYSYVDKSVASGNYTYRLRQVDFDGKSNYSNEVEVNVNLPKVYSLAQNYPNPFNPSTKIDFNLAVDSKVTLKVFNILGQEVTTLLNGSMTAGSHNVTFDASRLTSGVYLYKIEAKGSDGSSFTSIKKMILTK